MKKVKVTPLVPILTPIKKHPKRTENYNKLGEVTKRLNRQMETHKKKYGNKSDEYKKIQKYIKGLGKQYSEYNKSKHMWVLKTPRTKEGKEKIKSIQNTVQQNFLTIKEIETAKKLIEKRQRKTEKEKAKQEKRKPQYRKMESDWIFKRAIELAYLIQNQGTEAISGYEKEGVDYIDMYLDDTKFNYLYEGETDIPFE